MHCIFLHFYIKNHLSDSAPTLLRVFCVRGDKAANILIIQLSSSPISCLILTHSATSTLSLGNARMGSCVDTVLITLITKQVSSFPCYLCNSYMLYQVDKADSLCSDAYSASCMN